LNIGDPIPPEETPMDNIFGNGEGPAGEDKHKKYFHF
jgi:hypothetical protein